MNNNHIEILVNNMKNTLDNLVNGSSKYNNIINNDEKFNNISKLISMLQFEINDIKTKINDNSNVTINDNINTEIENLKNMITNVNEMSMINSNYDDEITVIKDVVNENSTKVDMLNNFVTVQLDNINEKLFNMDDVTDLNKDIKYLKSIILNDKGLKLDIDLLKKQIETIQFNIINTDYSNNNINYNDKINDLKTEMNDFKNYFYSNDLQIRNINISINGLKTELSKFNNIENDIIKINDKLNKIIDNYVNIDEINLIKEDYNKLKDVVKALGNKIIANKKN